MWRIEGMCHRYKISLTRAPTRNGSVTKVVFLLILEEIKNMLFLFPSLVSRIFQRRWNKVNNCLCSPILRCGKASKHPSFSGPATYARCEILKLCSCLVEEEDQAMSPFSLKRAENPENSWHFYCFSQIQHRSSFYKLCHGLSSLLPAWSILVQRQEGWLNLW